VPADLVQEELERVGRARRLGAQIEDRGRRGLRLGGRLVLRLDPLDAARVQLLDELGELRLVEVVLERQRVDVDLTNSAALVGLVDELAQKFMLQGGGGQCSLRSFLSARDRCEPATPLEPRDAAAASLPPLRARVGGVAARADVYVRERPRGRGLDRRPAGRAGDGGTSQFGVNASFHRSPFCECAAPGHIRPPAQRTAVESAVGEGALIDGDLHM
jgi:hypothetical protein